MYVNTLSWEVGFSTSRSFGLILATKNTQTYIEVFGLPYLCRTPHLDWIKDVTPICIPDVQVATHNTKPENRNMY